MLLCDSSFAYGFNNADGGVFALSWNNSAGISIWHFAHADILADLIAQTAKRFAWNTSRIPVFTILPHGDQPSMIIR
jgi:hypothetical protein